MSVTQMHFAIYIEYRSSKHEENTGPYDMKNVKP